MDNGWDEIMYEIRKLNDEFYQLESDAPVTKNVNNVIPSRLVDNKR